MMDCRRSGARDGDFHHTSPPRGTDPCYVLPYYSCCFHHIHGSNVNRATVVFAAKRAKARTHIAWPSVGLPLPFLPPLSLLSNRSSVQVRKGIRPWTHFFRAFSRWHPPLTKHRKQPQDMCLSVSDAMPNATYRWGPLNVIIIHFCSVVRPRQPYICIDESSNCRYTEDPKILLNKTHIEQ